MLSLQQVIKTSGNADQFYKFLKHVTTTATATPAVAKHFARVTSPIATATYITKSTVIPKQRKLNQQLHVSSQHDVEVAAAAEAKRQKAAQALNETNFKAFISHISHLNVNGCETRITTPTTEISTKAYLYTKGAEQTQLQQRRQLHTQSQQQTNAKQQQHPHQQQQQHNTQHHPQQQKQTHFAMSSLAAEPQLQAATTASTSPEIHAQNNGSAASSASHGGSGSGGASCHQPGDAGVEDTAAAGKKPCFNTGLAEILQFMELIGNLKHTKRTGWVLRDVNDCESISGHMYRMSMLTFLLDGSEGLNQIRCMELALVHDLAESLVGDITPFCGVSKCDKRAMEFKAMEDICKLIEPRGKRIMELFEEYEHGESAESKFVKDLDRLDMVMQAFEYEKRDDCLLKHQEFFDSTEGKFKHPFVQKLVNEIYEQRRVLAKAKGATPPPPVHVPSMDDTAPAAATTTSTSSSSSSSNGHQQQSSS